MGTVIFIKSDSSAGQSGLQNGEKVLSAAEIENGKKLRLDIENVNGILIDLSCL